MSGDLGGRYIRLLVGQNIGLKFLIPLSLEKLARDPFEYGDMYPGDLLNSVVSTESEYWVENGALLDQLKEIIESAHKCLASVNPGKEIDTGTILSILKQFNQRF